MHQSEPNECVQLKDQGSFAKALVDMPPGKHLIGAGSYISFKGWCDIFSKVNNVPCVFEQMSIESYEEPMELVYGI